MNPSTLFENETLIVRHDCFAANLIADCAFGIARLPWNARNMLAKIQTSSFSAFELSVQMLGGKVTTGRPL